MMKFLKAFFVLRVTASLMALPIESANGDIVVTPCNWNKKCFIICSDRSEPAAELSDGVCLGICGIGWTLGVGWVEKINFDGYEIDSTSTCRPKAESFVKRELDVGAHADWKDTLDVGAHVDWNNKADTKAEV